MPTDDRLADLMSRWHAADERGEPVDPERLCADAPDLLPALRQGIEFARRLTELAGDLPPTAPAAFDETLHVPPAHRTPNQSDTNPDAALAREPVRPPTDMPPGYQFLRELGRGGMGVVYLARQTAADRLVALKMVLAGSWAAPEELARFRAEARAVGGINHPNVVAVYDVGEHAGLPYFSLEYCPAGSLRDRLRGEPLPPRDAAALLRQVAAGVAAAHARDIVHRDLKPQNVLFQGTGDRGQGSGVNEGSGLTPDPCPLTPKVADFGLAKGRGDDRLTTTGSVLGTPAYMAPEQARGEAKDVGPPADVWALGAILYECLTGRPPFQGASMMATLDLVRSADPVGPRLLNPVIPRDLETVCLKCLRKEPGQRYPTAAELAADLGRFLDGRPVVARPVGRAEKAWKLARRNPREAALFAALTAVIVLALGTTTYLWRQAHDREREANVQRTRAEQSEADARTALDAAKQAQVRAAVGEQLARTEATRAQSAAEFLGGLFEASDPLQMSAAASAIPRLRGEKLGPHELLLRGAEQLDKRSDLSPDARATLAYRIGNSFLTIGDFPNARKYLGDAQARLEKLLPPDHADLADVYHARGWMDHILGNYDEAEALFRRAAAIQEKLDQTDPRNVLLLTVTQMKLGILLAEKGDSGPAAAMVEQARVRRAELAKADPKYNRALGEAYLAEAIVAAEDGGANALRKMLTFGERGVPLMLGPGDDQLARAIRLFHEALALAYGQKRRDEAIAKLNECLRLTQSVLGPRHLYAVLVRGQLAFILDDFNQTAAAEPHFRECLAVGKEQQVLTHPKAGLAIVRLARLLARTKRPTDARAVIDDWLAEHEKTNPDTLKHADALTNGADVYADLGDQPAAVKALERAEGVYGAKLRGGRRRGFVANQQQLGAAYARQERWEPAEARFAAAMKAIDEHFPDDRRDDEYVETICGWAKSLARLGRYEPELEARLVEAQAALAKSKGTEDRSTLKAAVAIRLSELFRGRGDVEKATRTAREAAQVAVTGEAQFAVAEELAWCATAATGPEADRLKAEAVKALTTAARRGFRDANRLRTAEAFKDVRDRPDFRELVDKLSRP